MPTHACVITCSSVILSWSLLNHCLWKIIATLSLSNFAVQFDLINVTTKMLKCLVMQHTYTPLLVSSAASYQIYLENQ